MVKCTVLKQSCSECNVSVRESAEKRKKKQGLKPEVKVILCFYFTISTSEREHEARGADMIHEGRENVKYFLRRSFFFITLTY